MIPTDLDYMHCFLTASFHDIINYQSITSSNSDYSTNIDSKPQTINRQFNRKLFG